MQYLGNERISKKQKLALFCSNKCPGNLILKTYDLTEILRDAGITVISGFHTLMEKEALRILMRGEQPLILCLARSIDNWRMPAEYIKPLEDGRLLIISPFKEKQKRITAENSKIRNDLVVSLADAILIAHASPRSKTFSLAITTLKQGKSIYTIDDTDNSHLIDAGAKPVLVDSSKEARSDLCIRFEDFIEKFRIGA